MRTRVFSGSVLIALAVCGATLFGCASGESTEEVPPADDSGATDSTSGDGSGDTGSGSDSGGDTGGGGGDGSTDGGGEEVGDTGPGDTGPGDTGATCDPEAGLTISCGVGECTTVVDSCTEAGVPATCTPKTPGTESCNGKDDDCDGLVDEDLGETMCGTGECARTQKNCVDGSPKTCTPGTPGTETCNGKDDDCDGTADNGLGTTSCGVGECAVTVNNCELGSPKTCTPKVAGTETCNGKDDNCDGTIDDGNPGGGSPCNTGKPGVCAAGTTKCEGGAVVCVQNTAASAETCDGKDNDCDGAIDNGNPGGGLTCDTGKLGVCAEGKTACTSGSIACNQVYAPSAELCDGLDNNCNGSTDEGNPGGGLGCSTGKPGICATGTTACSGGSVACIQNTPAKPTELCNGVDDDCDGVVDNGNPGGGVSCSTGKLGLCGSGLSACVGGAIQCPQSVFPSTELCDGKDNDCDGAVDNGNPGGGGACNTGKNGICAAGIWACSGGAPVCNQTNLPVAESCNTKDDDCDGLVDDSVNTADGNPTTCLGAAAKTVTVAAAGTQTVTGYVDVTGDDYFTVTFSGSFPATSSNFKPRIRWSAGGTSSEFKFEVLTACGVPAKTGATGTSVCGSALDDWSMAYAPPTPSCITSGPNCTDSFPKVQTYIVHVTHASTYTSTNYCNQYSLLISN